VVCAPAVSLPEAKPGARELDDAGPAVSLLEANPGDRVVDSSISSARFGTIDGVELALGLSIGTADDDGGADPLLDAGALDGARDCRNSSRNASKEIALLTLRRLLISSISTLRGNA